MWTYEDLLLTGETNAKLVLIFLVEFQVKSLRWVVTMVVTMNICYYSLRNIRIRLFIR